MSTLITILCCAFDIVILILFFYSTFESRKKHIKPPFLVIGFIISEAILVSFSFIHLANHQAWMGLINLFVGFLSTFALSFFYNSSMAHRIFASVSFLLCSAISEYIVVATFSNKISYNDITDALTEGLLSCIGKFILLIIILCICIFWKKKKVKYNLLYKVSISTTPLISTILLYLFPVMNLNYYAFFTSIVCLFILNALNYMLLSNMLRLNESQQKNAVMEQQLMLQAEKYNQLTSEYKKSRRIIHDTKKHFSFIKAQAEQKNYNGIIDYISQGIHDLDNTYNRFNTGNLVLDTFLSNHLIMAQTNGIEFNTDIRIDIKKIPISDYDLSIIIGNLLDNSFNSVVTITPPKEKFINIHIITTSNSFVINIENPIGPVSEKADNNELYHGYGQENAQKIIEKYSGVYTFTKKENYECKIVVPIIN